MWSYMDGRLVMQWTGSIFYRDKRLTVVVYFVDDVDDTALYFLSANGTDTATCGETFLTACKTLDHVLRLFYNASRDVGRTSGDVGRTSGDVERTLQIVTSESLQIDPTLMVSLFMFL